MLALAGIGEVQITTGTGPDGVPAAVALTVNPAITLDALAGPVLFTVTATVATSPAFM
jgi:hypothetical protein